MGEKHQSVASYIHPNHDQSCNPGMCPDGESNSQPFSLYDDTQPTVPYQPGPVHLFFPLIFFPEGSQTTRVVYDSPVELLSSSIMFIWWHQGKYKKLSYEAHCCIYCSYAVEEVVHYVPVYKDPRKTFFSGSPEHHI